MLQALLSYPLYSYCQGSGLNARQVQSLDWTHLFAYLISPMASNIPTTLFRSSAALSFLLVRQP